MAKKSLPLPVTPYNKSLFIVLSLITALVLICVIAFMGIWALQQKNSPASAEKYMPCAVLSSSYAVDTCHGCIDDGDAWTMAEGCVSKHNPKFACKDEVLYDDSKNCLNCYDQGGIWINNRCIIE